MFAYHVQGSVTPRTTNIGNGNFIYRSEGFRLYGKGRIKKGTNSHNLLFFSRFTFYFCLFVCLFGGSGGDCMRGECAREYREDGVTGGCEPRHSYPEY